MYQIDILEINENVEVVKKSEKVIYNTDNSLAANVYAKSLNKTKKKIDFVHLSNPLNVVKNGTIKITEDFLGYMNCNGNNVRYNTTLVGLYTAIFSGGGVGVGHSPGFSINSQNFFISISYFTARKLIHGDWINWYDEYLAPNEEHEHFKQFKYDSIVYSLFESKSNQSSLRHVEYKDQLWDIKNEFFWMSVEKMKELADQNGYDELYNDARTSPDRYVYKLLLGEERIYDKLSPDAKLVLDKATELVERSMELRQVMANDENHLNSWDAGYAQLKLVWKEYFQEEFKEFRQLYKNLEERMRPLVYELGFLKK
jgi:hypothetical protein